MECIYLSLPISHISCFSFWRFPLTQANKISRGKLNYQRIPSVSLDELLVLGDLCLFLPDFFSGPDDLDKHLKLTCMVCITWKNIITAAVMPMLRFLFFFYEQSLNQDNNSM